MIKATSKYLIAIGLGILILNGVSERSSGQAVADQITIQQIIDGLHASEEALLGGDPFVVRAQRVDSQVVTPSRYGGGYLNVEFLVAYRDGQYLCHKHFLRDPSENASTDAELYLPPRPSMFTVKESVLFDWQMAGPSASVRSIDQVGDMFQCLDYFRHLGFDVARRIIESNGGNYERLQRRKDFADDLDHPFLPYFLEQNRGRYTISSSQEVVDGVPCWVLEYPGMDKLWVDVQHGFAVRRRVYHFDAGEPRKFDIQNLDLQKVKPSLWLPRVQIVDKFASTIAEDKDIWDKVVCRMRYETKEISVGSVPDAIFDFEIPAGLIIDDSIRGIEYRVAKSTDDPFSKILADARLGIDRNRMTRYLLVFGTGVLFLAVYLVRRARRSSAALGLLLSTACLPLNGFAYVSCEDGSSSNDFNEHVMHSDHPTPSYKLRSVNDDILRLGLRGGAFNWVPAWREKSDCGPNALYVLMSLLGYEHSLQEVRNTLTIDPVYGCSVADLLLSAKKLNVPLESRFVKPSDLMEVQPPFILHGKASELQKTGHFIVVIAFSEDKKNAITIDPVLDSTSENPLSSILMGYSGYVVCPKVNTPAKRLVWGLVFVSLSLLSYAAFLSHHSSGSNAASR